MTQPLASLPPYQVRVSRRARRARIQVSPLGDVEVIIPQGFNSALIPAFMEGHRSWLNQVLARTRAQRPAGLDEPVPSQISLAAMNRSYALYYRQGTRNRVRESGGELEVFLSPQAELHKVLQRWLTQVARRYLSEVMAEVAGQTGLEFARLSVRGQRRRWGSCSAKADISLNRSLMFLQPDMVRYVVLHELCHTQHMNHSSAFWQLVASHEPGYKTLDRKLRLGWCSVPRWAVT